MHVCVVDADTDTLRPTTAKVFEENVNDTNIGKLCYRVQQHFSKSIILLSLLGLPDNLNTVKLVE